MLELRIPGQKYPMKQCANRAVLKRYYAAVDDSMSSEGPDADIDLTKLVHLDFESQDSDLAALHAQGSLREKLEPKESSFGSKSICFSRAT